MFRKGLPRVHELLDLIEDPSAPSAYFRDFVHSIRNDPLKKQVWLAREQDLGGLDLDSWEFLKKEALPYLTNRDQKRGWQQLITTLNQAFAYNFLRMRLGCSGVKFIPRATQKGAETPDLQGELNCLRVLCEVKTINVSEVEVVKRQNEMARTITDRLELGFFKKLMCDLKKAKSQMDAYDDRTNVRRIAYIVINFDDLFAEYKEQYYQQIDSFLGANPIPGIEVVFHNQRTSFHKSIVMTSATVVNE